MAHLHCLCWENPDLHDLQLLSLKSAHKKFFWALLTLLGGDEPPPGTDPLFFPQIHGCAPGVCLELRVYRVTSLIGNNPPPPGTTTGF